MLLISGVLFGIGCAALGSRIEVDNFLLGTVKKGHPIAQATRLLGQRLQGVVTMQVAVEGAAGSAALKKPKVLAAMQGLQRWIEAQPGVTGTLSAVDFILGSIAPPSARASCRPTPRPSRSSC